MKWRSYRLIRISVCFRRREHGLFFFHLQWFCVWSTCFCVVLLVIYSSVCLFFFSAIYDLRCIFHSVNFLCLYYISLCIISTIWIRTSYLTGEFHMFCLFLLLLLFNSIICNILVLLTRKRMSSRMCVCFWIGFSS